MKHDQILIPKMQKSFGTTGISSEILGFAEKEHKDWFSENDVKILKEKRKDHSCLF